MVRIATTNASTFYSRVPQCANTAQWVEWFLGIIFHSLHKNTCTRCCSVSPIRDGDKRSVAFGRFHKLLLIDRFRHERICHRSQDQEPHLRGWLHERMPDGHWCRRDFMRAFHAYAESHHTVSKLPVYDKNWPEAGANLQSTCTGGLWAKLPFIQPQNGFIGRVSWSFCDERLDEHWLSDVSHAIKPSVNGARVITSASCTHAELLDSVWNCAG